MGFLLISALQEEVKSYFLRAVQETQAQSIDAELQVILVTRLTYFTLTQTGLGVLFNLSGDYDKAADCFSDALQVKPQVTSHSAIFPGLTSLPRRTRCYGTNWARLLPTAVEARKL